MVERTAASKGATKAGQMVVRMADRIRGRLA